LDAPQLIKLINMNHKNTQSLVNRWGQNDDEQSFKWKFYSSNEVRQNAHKNTHEKYWVAS
jgi:hypothetical protein